MCYNEAIDYLKKRLGTRDIEIGRVTNKFDTRQRIKVYRDEKIIPYSNEDLIHRLLKQYSLGEAPKRELESKLIELKVI